MSISFFPRLCKSRVVISAMPIEFSERLRKWRGERTQKEAASVIGVPLRTYCSWEEEVNKPDALKMETVENRMAADELLRKSYTAATVADIPAYISGRG